MLICSNQAPAQLPALLQNLPLGSRARWLWPLINQGEVWQPPTPGTYIPPFFPDRKNSKATAREATIKRSQARQGPIQNPKLFLLALTPALYPLYPLCPHVLKVKCHRLMAIMCSAAHTPHQLLWPCWSVLHHWPGVQGMLPCCPGLPKAKRKKILKLDGSS